MNKIATTISSIVLSLTLSLTVQVSLADERYIDESSWQLGLAVGLGQSSTPLHGAKPLPLLLMPDVSYYGRYAFFDNGIFGISALREEHWTLSVVSRLNPEKGYFYRWHISNINVFDQTFQSMPTVSQEQELRNQQRAKVSVDQVSRRPTAWDAGVQLNAHYEQWSLRMNAWTDISGQHHGHQLSTVMSWYQQSAYGHWRWSAGLHWKSEQLIDRYYGIGANEAPHLPRYHGKASWQPEVEMGWSLPIRSGWSLMAFYRYRWLDNAMTRSPLVKQNYVQSWFIGWSYRFNS
ncbi:MipA/OmpV family protein [Alkalimonas collagenimarina]|uniref:MipA/OmpV family protein n=1 Tax=Alkalimonas collagenimarina TaxID=400390 RepID=A0ABT9GYD0_9GAMM|nr:MipA/OmpV family protein [Alkalimonas collagenimarina]MDP4536051.1 MipA/OmpV family protein [Alkalimonas collagenimarina]